ncbi:hypothetical protein Mgra_00004980 [Meloidogyne graminicola]|uniref:Uncharacterized protein n=1 Tax=Meloidogyne graminicola TaxID=189291 RepID=A0A8S9ZQ70_9BILA|nr:hypothetical protein Mgra_00004980 [Meloidogyne graminicola]
MPKWRIKLEEAKAEAKKRSEERKARVKRFQEEYCRWMKLPLPERRIAIKKWYAERRKECQNFWCPNFAKKENESEALQERAKIRREEALAKIEEIKNRNKLKAQARTKIPTIGSTIIGHSTFSPTNKLFNSSIMPETVISNEKSEIKENETKIEENKIKLNNESFNIEPTTPETIKSTIIIIPTTIFSEQLINKEKTEEIQTSTNPTNNIYNSTVMNNEQLIMERRLKLRRDKKGRANYL